MTAIAHGIARRSATEDVPATVRNAMPVALARSAETPLRILVATDAWRPQVNGVVRTHEWLAAEATKLGAEFHFVTPDRFHTIPMPTYPEIRLSLASKSRIGRIVEQIRPDAIHIATEGPIGFAMRRYCLAAGRRFTTCYHTRFPEYLAARFRLPVGIAYAALRRFHNSATATMVATAALEQELRHRGFAKTVLWRRGVNCASFASAVRRPLDLPRPIFLTVGRVAVEKNIEAFLQLDLPGTKLVVGDGPARERLQDEYPDCRFLGVKHGVELADLYASADVFVFPSRTDTFGLVMLEALCTGTPVAAFPVTGPREILGESGCGVMSEDLREAAMTALSISRDACRSHGLRHSMSESARSFIDNIRRAVLAA